MGTVECGKAECALGRGSSLAQALLVTSICWKGHPQVVCLPGPHCHPMVLKLPYSAALQAVCSVLAVMRLSRNL